MHWLFLTIAIVSEVIGTSALKASDGFTRLAPSLIVIAGYGTAFYFLALSLRVLPVGIAYAVWASVGMVLIALVGWVMFSERLDAWGMAGIVLIVIGVVLLTGVSGAVPHRD